MPRIDFPYIIHSIYTIALWIIEIQNAKCTCKALNLSGFPLFRFTLFSFCAEEINTIQLSILNSNLESHK